MPNNEWHKTQQARIQGAFLANYGERWADLLQRTYGSSSFRYQFIVGGLGGHSPRDGVTTRLPFVILTMQTAHYGWPATSLLENLDAAMTAFRNTDGVSCASWSLHFAEEAVWRYVENAQLRFDIIAPPAIGLCHAIGYSFYRSLVNDHTPKR